VYVRSVDRNYHAGFTCLDVCKLCYCMFPNELFRSCESRPPICCMVRLYSMPAKLSPVKHAGVLRLAFKHWHHLCSAVIIKVHQAGLASICNRQQSPFGSWKRMCTGGGCAGRITTTLSVGSSSSLRTAIGYVGGCCERLITTGFLSRSASSRMPSSGLLS
jgi:hypothetical protein